MGHTCYQQFIHILCATKKLEPTIFEEFKETLYAYMSAIVKGLGGQCIAISGTPNHVHLLLNAPPNYSISELVGQIKACSSKWYRKQDTRSAIFGWTDGYLAFSVSPSSIDNVKQYFSQEERHHTEFSVQEEIVNFLKFHDIISDPKYLINTTYTRLIYHLVWSVKYRELLLGKSIQENLHQNIQNSLYEKKAKLHAIGNVADHIHLLIESPSKIATADLVVGLKVATTNMLRSMTPKLQSFSWQEGYGVFSVGKPAYESAVNYVKNQENHHRYVSFDHEWKQFLAGCKLEDATLQRVIETNALSIA